MTPLAHISLQIKYIFRFPPVVNASIMLSLLLLLLVLLLLHSFLCGCVILIHDAIADVTESFKHLVVAVAGAMSLAMTLMKTTVYGRNADPLLVLIVSVLRERSQDQHYYPHQHSHHQLLPKSLDI